MRSGDVQLTALVESCRQQDSVELRSQVGEGDVPSHGHASMQRDAHGEDVVHFHLDDLPREAELRDAEIEHSAWDRCGLEYFDGVAQESQIVRTGETAHARPHNGDALVALRSWGQLLSCRIVTRAQVVPIGGVALQRADSDGLVDLAATAGVFAGMRADSSQHVCERIGRASQKIRFLIFGYPDGLHIASTFCVDRAGGTTRNILVEILLVRDGDGIAHSIPTLRN